VLAGKKRMKRTITTSVMWGNAHLLFTGKSRTITHNA
jgi:hypothetical protein